MNSKVRLTIIIAGICSGPLLIAWAQFGLGANLLDGLWGSYSNSRLQEGVISAGMFATLIGGIVAASFYVKSTRTKVHAALAALGGVGIFLAPWVLLFIIFAMPS